MVFFFVFGVEGAQCVPLKRQGVFAGPRSVCVSGWGGRLEVGEP